MLCMVSACGLVVPRSRLFKAGREMCAAAASWSCVQSRMPRAPFICLTEINFVLSTFFRNSRYNTYNGQQTVILRLTYSILSGLDDHMNIERVAVLETT